MIDWVGRNSQRADSICNEFVRDKVKMPMMITSATMVNGMREVLLNGSLTQEERDLLVRPATMS